ncbi:hypothetical protein HELRODRAFT_167439 [Helobdella robusta]|uniref:C2 domain-containing protein n=1 Tax=Helobdella robusta TaxID=6412 RepID=T1EZD7_HELRO|nr:hypothetical protein HELRODRAFT_167439 [Helobdella robusta]ESO10924.1 hypothetical protein HELRODRAFT_167439 [Helobdella robusta]
MAIFKLASKSPLKPATTAKTSAAKTTKTPKLTSGSAAGAGRRNRRASMHDALDCSMIDASLYRHDVITEEDAISTPTPRDADDFEATKTNDDDVTNGRSRINLTAIYSYEQNLLTVQLISARDLPPAPPTDSTFDQPQIRYTFARLRLVDKSNRRNRRMSNPALLSREYLQTRLQPELLNPRFNEEFLFEVFPTKAVKHEQQQLQRQQNVHCDDDPLRTATSYNDDDDDDDDDGISSNKVASRKTKKNKEFSNRALEVLLYRCASDDRSTGACVATALVDLNRLCLADQMVEVCQEVTAAKEVTGMVIYFCHISTR